VCRVDINDVKLLLAVIRQAEHDYLKYRPGDYRYESARYSLYGPSNILRPICKIFGISYEAAMLHLVMWKARGFIGDPIFGFLSDPNQLDNYLSGKPLQIPRLEEIADEAITRSNFSGCKAWGNSSHANRYVPCRYKVSGKKGRNYVRKSCDAIIRGEEVCPMDAKGI